MEIKNVSVELLNIYEELPVKNVNLVVLDLPEPWRALENVKEAMVRGGFLVSYSPCIPQVQDMVEAARKSENFVYLKTNQ